MRQGGCDRCEYSVTLTGKYLEKTREVCKFNTIFMAQEESMKMCSCVNLFYHKNKIVNMLALIQNYSAGYARID